MRSKRLNGAASSTVLHPVRVAPAVDADVGHSQPSAPSPASTVLAVAPQRAARSTGIIELDISGAVLRLRGLVDEASLRSVLRQGT